MVEVRRRVALIVKTLSIGDSWIVSDAGRSGIPWGSHLRVAERLG